MRLIEAVNLKIEEAALTGESVPVEKNAASVMDADATLGDRKNTAFSGTVVTYGRGKGVVVSTGMNTQIGLIATMLQSVEDEETPLQRRLDQLGKTLGWATMVISGLVFLSGLIEGGARTFSKCSWWLSVWLSRPFRKGCPRSLPSVLRLVCARWSRNTRLSAGFHLWKRLVPRQ